MAVAKPMLAYDRESGEMTGAGLIDRTAVTNTWITEMLGRRPFNVRTVALAHKTARIAWAIMANGEEYRARA